MGLYTVTMARKNGGADSVGNHAPATSVARTLHGRALIVKEDIVGNAAGEGAAGVTAKNANCVATARNLPAPLQSTKPNPPAISQQTGEIVVINFDCPHP